MSFVHRKLRVSELDFNIREIGSKEPALVSSTTGVGPGGPGTWLPDDCRSDTIALLRTFAGGAGPTKAQLITIYTCRPMM